MKAFPKNTSPEYQDVPTSINTKIFFKIKKENGRHSFNTLIEYTIIDAKNNPKKTPALSQRNLFSMMLRIFNAMEEQEELEIWQEKILSLAAKAFIRQKFHTRSHKLDILIKNL